MLFQSRFAINTAMLTRLTFAIFMSGLLTSCAYLQENLKDEKPPAEIKPQLSERELLFNSAEVEFKKGSDKAALPMYLHIVRDPAEGADPIYEKSLLNLGKIYERNDQSEKAILAFEELLKTNSKVISKTSLRMLIIKNHFRVANYYQAKSVRAEIDSDYKTRKIYLQDLYQALYYQTNLYLDHHILDELLFIGEIQKFFVYVIESDLDPESERMTELLILYYKHFVTQLDMSVMSPELKKNLIISLINQLNKFDRYKMEGNAPLSNFNRFSNFANETQRKLTERLANGKF